MWYVEDLVQGNRIQESEVTLSHGDLSYGQLGSFQLFLIVPGFPLFTHWPLLLHMQDGKMMSKFIMLLWLFNSVYVIQFSTVSKFILFQFR